MIGRTSALDVCYTIMQWIDAHPGERRYAKDIANDTGIPMESIYRTVNKTFPHVFYRKPKIGYCLSGEKPDDSESVPVEVITPPTGQIPWDADAMKVVNLLFRNTFDKTPLQLLQGGTLKDAENTIKVGQMLIKMAQEMIDAEVIGTEQQAEWRPIS